MARGLRPLLLLEDVTAFQLLGDRLLDYLLDLSSGHFDAVIGVTLGYERTQLGAATLEGDLTHIHHRLCGRFVLTDEHGHAYGLEDDLLGYARSYLTAVRAASAGAAWTTPPGFDDDLYPFTPTALRRALAQLHEEGNPRQTPRLFLKHVLGGALRASDLPCSAFDRSAYLVRPPALFRGDDVADERLQSLLRWYGEDGEDAVTLDRTIADAWQVPVPDHLVVDGEVRAPRTYLLRTPGAMTSDWQTELRDLQQWLALGGLYPSRETLKRGIERLLLGFGDPRSLASPHSLSVAHSAICYSRGEERLPIMLGAGSGDQPGGATYVKIEVTNTPEERAILEELVYLALSDGSLAEICQNLALTLAWGERHWASYQREVRALLTRSLDGLSPEALVWMGWQLVCGLRGVTWESCPPTILPAGADDQGSPWGREHGDCAAAGAALLAWQEPLRRLFIGAFTLHDALLDHARYHALADTLQPMAALATLASLPLPALRALPYKIRPMGQSLIELLAPLQRYAAALVSLDLPALLAWEHETLAAQEQHLAAQRGLDTALLQAQLATLRWRCGELGVPWRSTWDAALDLLRAWGVEDVATLAESLAALRAALSDVTNLWSYQSFRHRRARVAAHPYWGALAQLTLLQEELAGAAQTRYRRDGRVLTGTAPYRALLQAAHALEELLHA